MRPVTRGRCTRRRPERAARATRWRPSGRRVRRDVRGEVTIAVTDGGGPTRPLPAKPSVTARGGRGLAIITALARDWGGALGTRHPGGRATRGDGLGRAATRQLVQRPSRRQPRRRAERRVRSGLRGGAPLAAGRSSTAPPGRRRPGPARSVRGSPGSTRGPCRPRRSVSACGPRRPMPARGHSAPGVRPAPQHAPARARRAAADLPIAPVRPSDGPHGAAPPPPPGGPGAPSADGGGCRRATRIADSTIAAHLENRSHGKEAPTPDSRRGARRNLRGRGSSRRLPGGGSPAALPVRLGPPLQGVSRPGSSAGGHRAGAPPVRRTSARERLGRDA